MRHWSGKELSLKPICLFFMIASTGTRDTPFDTISLPVISITTDIRVQQGDCLLTLHNGKTCHFAIQSLEVGDVGSEEKLVTRVRVQIGHVISQARAVDVSAHQGRITLSGSFATHEVEKLLSAVASIAGITAVVNRLKGDHAIASAGGVRDNHIMHQRDS